MKSYFFKFVISLITLFTISYSVTAALAADTNFLKITPTLLDSYNDKQLQEFGLNAVNQAYSMLSSFNQPVDAANPQSKLNHENAAKNSEALFNDSALIQNAWLNYGITKKTLLPYLYMGVDNFDVTDLILTRPTKDIIVVTFNVALSAREGLKGGATMSGESLPRISTLKWNQDLKQWQIFSHADFDTPQAIICGITQNLDLKKSTFKSSDIKLGRQLINDLVQSKLKGYDPNVFEKGYQITFASRERNVNRAILTKPIKPINIEAVKSGDLLAVRYDMPNALIVDGVALEDKVRPRLLTYHLGQDGKWRLVSSAVFGLTEKVANNTKCIPPEAR